MGKDKHFSVQATEITYLGKKHIFHIVDDDFPLPKEGYKDTYKDTTNIRLKKNISF